jgi:hypothetical protein
LPDMAAIVAEHDLREFIFDDHAGADHVFVGRRCRAKRLGASMNIL